MAVTSKWGIYSDDPGQLALGNTQDTRQAASIEAALDKAVSTASFYKQPVLATTDSTALGEGIYYATNASNATGAGMPDNYPGMLLSAPVGSSGGVQTYYSLLGRTFTRRKTGGTWSDWVASESNVSRRQLLQQGLQARKGGIIGTGGKGAIALRFDDYPVEFREKVLPLLAERNLPFTRVTTSESVHTETIEESEFSAMQEYSLQYGGEVWNHGRTHGNAVNMGDVQRELISPLKKFRDLMPRIPIDCFAPAGGSVTYGGYMPANTIENYSETFAGQQVIEHHALVSGYFQDAYWWQLDGELKDGYNHYSMDAYTYERAVERASQARDNSLGMVFMWHPRTMEAEGRMGMEDFTRFLDWLVEQRDFGALEVLTVSGLAVADAGSDMRHDVLNLHSSPDDAGIFSETVTFPRYRRGIPGSTRELTALVSGTPGQKVTSIVGESTRVNIIPDTGYLNLRHVCTIPLDIISLKITIDAKSDDVHLYAV